MITTETDLRNYSQSKVPTVSIKSPGECLLNTIENYIKLTLDYKKSSLELKKRKEMGYSWDRVLKRNYDLN